MSAVCAGDSKETNLISFRGMCWERSGGKFEDGGSGNGKDTPWVGYQVVKFGLYSIGNRKSVKVYMFKITLHGCSNTVSCKAIPTCNATHRHSSLRLQYTHSNTYPLQHRHNPLSETFTHKDTLS